MPVAKITKINTLFTSILGTYIFYEERNTSVSPISCNFSCLDFAPKNIYIVFKVYHIQGKHNKCHTAKLFSYPVGGGAQKVKKKKN